MKTFGSQSMVARLRRVIVKRPEEAFLGPGHAEKQWQDLAYTRPRMSHMPGGIIGNSLR
jgi:hypothetical protein